MITRISIPQLFENMEEATIGAWLKSEGDSVRAGDSLCELVTEKTTLPLEAEAAGVLRSIVAPEKSIVPVGFVIGIVADQNDEIAAIAQQIETENAALRSRKSQSETASETPLLSIPKLGVPSLALSLAPSANAAANSGSRIRATPAARRLAREMNLDIEQVAAKFPGKVLSEDDVRNFEL